MAPTGEEEEKVAEDCDESEALEAAADSLAASDWREVLRRKS